MQFSIDETIFDTLPEFEAGVVAIKGIDNLTPDNDIEAFLRHASLEAELLLTLKPLSADAGLAAYRAALSKIGAEEAVSSVEETFLAFVESLAAVKEKEEFTPGGTTGLSAALALPRENPVLDLVRGAELQFRMPVLAFDTGRAEEPLRLTEDAGDFLYTLGGKPALRNLYCAQEAGCVDGETRNLLLVLPCFAVNRRKAMSVRNELARRLKDSFGRASESAWLSREDREYVSKI